MKKIVLKISLLLIATIFSTHIYSAELAAKEKTAAEKVTPGGGAAPAQESFSSVVNQYNQLLHEELSSLSREEERLKKMQKINTKELTVEQKQLYDRNLRRVEKRISVAKNYIPILSDRLKQQIEDERREREEKAEKAE